MASREHSGPPRDRSLPRAVLAGAALGALAGLTFGAWEVGIVGWLGLRPPSDELLQATAVLYAVTGAVCGAVAGTLRKSWSHWALTYFLLLAAWLVCGKVGMALEASGSYALVAPLLLLPSAFALGLIVASSELPEGFALAVAAVGSILLVLGLPVNLHLLSSPFSGLALFVDAAILIIALLVGSLTALLIDRAGLLLPMLLAAALGTVAAWAWLDEPEAPWPKATSSSRGPIVLVIVDTLRADHLGAYGYGRATSPNFDRATRRGQLFMDVTAAAPWTLPSVGSLLTGVLPSQHGAGVNLGLGNERTPLRPAVPTLAGRLREAGYTTAGIITNPWLTSALGFQRGFDRYDDAVAPAATPAALHPLLVLGVPVPWPLYRPASDITDQALAFLAAQDHSQWFLLVHYMDVHGPLHPDDEDRDALGQSGQGPLVDAYDASVHEVDRHLGRLLDALPTHATVVITSDHGEELTERRAVGPGVPEGTRHGHTMYQELLHVPLLVLGPGIGAGRVSRPVSAHDIPATLFRLAGLAQPERPGGRPLAEIVGGTLDEHQLIYADSICFGNEQQVARRGAFKLVRQVGGGTSLYDLQTEPRELRGVQDSDPEVKLRVAALKADLPAVGVATVTGKPPLGAQLTELLQRLGYVDPPEAP